MCSFWKATASTPASQISTESSLGSLLQEDLHNPSILPSKDALLQSLSLHRNHIPSLTCLRPSMRSPLPVI